MDINCDMGEGMGKDALLMPFINLANIACGGHAGDRDTMKTTIRLCQQHGVAIGAHPSFPDREHFGRKEMTLSPEELREHILQQLQALSEQARACGAVLIHVKPHGALYNLSARDAATAATVAQAVRTFDPRLKLVGLSGSYSLSEAAKAGLTVLREAFADRRYLDDGSLCPRTDPRALITDPQEAVRQVRQIREQGTVTSLSGLSIPLQADTVCLHGDGTTALAIARALHENFRS